MRDFREDNIVYPDTIQGAQSAFSQGSGIDLIEPSAEGYRILKKSKGVVSFIKEYDNGDPDYVTQVNLKVAKIRSISGDIQGLFPGEGTFGGNNGQVHRKHLTEFWNDAHDKWRDKAYAIVNGAFFSTSHDPCGIAFPLKEAMEHISDGYGSASEYQNPFQISAFSFGEKNSNTFAKIKKYENLNELREHFTQGGRWPNIVGGLDEEANKSRNSWVGRTFFALKGDVLLIFASSFATQEWSRDILVNDFNCNTQEMIMFDGGGSTQLMIKGQQYVSSSRFIPQAFAIVAGDNKEKPDINIGADKPMRR